MKMRVFKVDYLLSKGSKYMNVDSDENFHCLDKLEYQPFSITIVEGGHKKKI